MRELHQQQRDFRTANLPPLKFGFPIPLSAIWGFCVGILVTIAVTSSEFLDQAFLDSLAPEAIGILVTILVIDQLNRQNEHRQYKRRLIHEMGSRVNDIAAQAVEELRKEGWLYDGSLKGADLKLANLQRVHLESANLQGVSLYGAELDNAGLFEANLQGATLYGAKLQGAYLAGADLQGAILLGANLRDAREIKEAIFDENTRLPNADNWYEGYDITRFTDSKHKGFWNAEEDEFPMVTLQ